MSLFSQMKQGIAPCLMGGAMGVMMLWMAHGALSGGSAIAVGALVGFVGVHLVLVVLAVGVVWAGTRLSPKFARIAARLHRPSLRHVGLMLGSAAVVAFGVHIIVHGGIA